MSMRSIIQIIVPLIFLCLVMSAIRCCEDHFELNRQQMQINKLKIEQLENRRLRLEVEQQNKN
jgi:hypothetical protein